MEITTNDPLRPSVIVSLKAQVTFVDPLIAWWPLDTDATDATGNGFDGVVIEPILFEQEGANAATGKSAYFEGGGHIAHAGDWVGGECERGGRGVFRKTVVRPLPEGSRILAGGTKAKLPSGRTVQVNESGKMVDKLATWYTRHNGKVVALCSDKSSALAMEAELRIDKARESAGLPSGLRFDGGRPLTELATLWLDELESAGRHPGHIAKLSGRISGILQGARLATLSDLASPAAVTSIASYLKSLKSSGLAVRVPGDKEFTPAQVRTILGISAPGLSKLALARGVPGTGNGKARRFSRAEVETLVAHRARGLSPATVNGYSAAIRGFSNWLRKKGLIPAVPSLPMRADEKKDRRIVRRALTVAEVKHLAESVRLGGRERAGLSADARATLYLAAFWTLLRRRALSEITPADCHLDGDRPWIQVRGETDKTGRSRAIPIPPGLAVTLREIVDQGAKNRPVWAISAS